ncbi:transcriptional regulator [Gallibacterium anatis]|uniref:IclR family transcriptional regulator n=1 Tax=Gallibacterium anatis TaxID=750 RepID=UPI0005318730|nr:IclR family transcriptional regulator [Gallibacterium anatis]KGQ24297.1 transcriptional regulator [Gallibacterium anatis CCM5995]KGQ43891.1 transcriptional regulator [Gallibacterium anatis]KGQ54118.1 transcriptional regulator [Gallibacterium anatis]KGQ61407.1 transcriptional regulator [Gallibacterium anatis]KGQ65217.1 transcriptional regulator [Gallibacterium anatis]
MIIIQNTEQSFHIVNMIITTTRKKSQQFVNKMEKENKNSLVPALQKAIQILNFLSEQTQPISAAEVSKLLNLPRSSVHNLLHTMLDNGVVQKNENQQFMLGTKILQWANALVAEQDMISKFYQAIKQFPELEPYTLTLSTLNQDQVIYLACKNSSLPLGITFKIGMHFPAIFTATGKAILSTFTDAQLAPLLENLPAPFTDTGVTSIEQIQQEMSQIRKQGYAIDNGQLRKGMYCYGIALPNKFGTAKFGLAASLLEYEAQDQAVVDQLLTALKQLAEELKPTIFTQSN